MSLAQDITKIFPSLLNCPGSAPADAEEPAGKRAKSGKTPKTKVPTARDKAAKWSTYAMAWITIYYDQKGGLTGKTYADKV